MADPRTEEAHIRFDFKLRSALTLRSAMSILVRILEARSVRKRQHDLRKMRDLVAPRPEASLLDLGGGGGTATLRFADGCRRIVVLEPDRRKLRYGRRRHPSLGFVRGTAEALPFANASFERIVAVVSFHHVAKPDLALQEVRRVLSPGGTLVLHELHAEGHSGWFRHVLGKRHHGSTPRFYEPAELHHTLESHGFQRTSIVEGVRGYFVTASR